MIRWFLAHRKDGLPDLSFNDIKTAVYNYFTENPKLQPPPCENQDFEGSPKNLNNPESPLTESERRMLKNASDGLMRAIPQICKTDHHFRERKAKDKSRESRDYDRNIFNKEKGQGSIFETMFLVSSNPPLRVRLHIVTTAKNQAQMDFLWRKIKDYCGEPVNPPPLALISTLGESPGVVTSAVHYFETIQEQSIRFDKIVVVGPENKDIRQNCHGLLKNQETISNRLDYQEFGAYDIRTQEDLKIFMDKIGEIVDSYINNGYQIYLNLAGGRKVMSGALLILAQIFPIEKVFHISILDKDLDEDIEESGVWNKLNQLKYSDPDKFQKILYPDKISALEFDISIFSKTKNDF